MMNSYTTIEELLAHPWEPKFTKLYSCPSYNWLRNVDSWLSDLGSHLTAVGYADEVPKNAKTTGNVFFIRKLARNTRKIPFKKEQVDFMLLSEWSAGPMLHCATFIPILRLTKQAVFEGNGISSWSKLSVSIWGHVVLSGACWQKPRVNKWRSLVQFLYTWFWDMLSLLIES